MLYNNFKQSQGIQIQRQKIKNNNLKFNDKFNKKNLCKRIIYLKIKFDFPRFHIFAVNTQVYCKYILKTELYMPYSDYKKALKK